LFSVTMDVEVEAIRLLPNSNNVRAYVDIRIGQPYGWLIRDFRVLKTDGHKYLVNGPQTSWRDPTSGQIRIKQILSLPDDQRQVIEAIVLSAYLREKEKSDGKPEAPPSTDPR